MPEKPFSKIDEILKSTLKHLNVEKKFRIYPLLKQWESIVGPAIAQKTHPEALYDRTLVVAVENSVWMSELEWQKKSLLEKIRHACAELDIEQIRFTMAK